MRPLSCVRVQEECELGIEMCPLSCVSVHLYDPVRIAADLPRLLQLIGRKRVGDRPDRYEPRAVKRRPKPHPLLRMTRKKAQALIKRGKVPYNKA